MQNNNIFILDVVRALCVLWIVLIWHGNEYLPVEYHFASTIIPRIITKIVLVTFTLLSGILLAKYKFSTKKDVWIFYKRRLARFYFLFFVATLLFYFCGFYSLKASIKCLSGMIVVLGQAPLTLWYMSMLMFFYFITPIIRYDYKNRQLKIIWNIFIILFMVTLYTTNVMADCFPIYYLFCYEIGLLVGEKVIPWLRLHDWNTNTLVYMIFTKIAYASFCIYLYHRVIYYAVGCSIGYADVNSSPCMPVWGNIIAATLSIIVPYGVQKAYDKFLDYIS